MKATAAPKPVAGVPITLSALMAKKAAMPMEQGLFQEAGGAWPREGPKRRFPTAPAVARQPSRRRLFRPCGCQVVQAETKFQALRQCVGSGQQLGGVLVTCGDAEVSDRLNFIVKKGRIEEMCWRLVVSPDARSTKRSHIQKR